MDISLSSGKMATVSPIKTSEKVGKQVEAGDEEPARDRATEWRRPSSSTTVNEQHKERLRNKSQASIISFGGSSQRMRPFEHENDQFLKRFAVNNEEVSEDNIKYHSLCFGM